MRAILNVSFIVSRPEERISREQGKVEKQSRDLEKRQNTVKCRNKSSCILYNMVAVFDFSHVLYICPLESRLSLVYRRSTGVSELLYK